MLEGSRTGTVYRFLRINKLSKLAKSRVNNGWPKRTFRAPLLESVHPKY